MNKKNRLLFGLILITMFTSSLLNISTINDKNNTITDQKHSYNHPYKDPIEENPTILEDLKTANSYESGLNYSFDIRMVEIANNSWSYTNYNSTGGGGGKYPPTTFMQQHNYNGANSSFEFYLTGLINSSSPTKDVLRPNDFSYMNYNSFVGLPTVWESFTINDDGPGKGYSSGYVYLNKTVDFGASVILYSYDGYTNVTYNASLYLFNAISNRTQKATFIPTTDNTQSDFIEWELSYDNKYYYNHYGQWEDFPDDYKAIIELDNQFIVGNALGRTGSYWDSLYYERNSTHLTIYGSYQEYKIEFNSPNYISITYNDNLTMLDKNELHLNVKCKMDGDLTIRFTDTNGTTQTEPFDNVQKNDIKSYNYIMRGYSKGGIGYLNVTLTNSSDIHFGVKQAEIAFHKRSQIFGFTDNTSAFEPNFYVGALFLDVDYIDYLITQGYFFESDSEFIFNKTMIPYADIIYELLQYSGELDYIEHPDPSLDLWLYLIGVDLRELQITPDEYNITFRASKLGYESSEFIVKPWVVSKRNATVEILATSDTLEVEQEFTLTVNLYVNYTNDQGISYLLENYLRIPASVNLSFINLATGEIDGPNPWWGSIVQSFTLFDQFGNLPKVSNDTIPGFYKINITIDSDYYQGSDEYTVKIIEKPLTISLNYESKVDEDEAFDITWDLEHGNFTGNRENMTMEIYLDGLFYTRVNFTEMNSSSGGVRFKLDDGDHTITYRLVSPFYTAERTISIEAEKGSSKPKEISWIEENWPFLLLLILAVIAMSIFGVYMTISRRKVKAQRELESELVALKTKYAATEKNVSLIETQISQIAGIYWILIIHSEQGVTMVEIADFMFDKVLSKEYQQLAEQGVIRDSALIGGFLTAIRNFSRETSDISEHQAIFNSQTDYSTVVNDKEVHRRILEGSNYFMAFISARGTTEISDVLGAINSIFNDDYGEVVKSFLGRISVFDPFKIESVAYLHNMIIEMQKKLEDEKLMLEHYQRHLKQVQDKIGIKKNK